MVKWRGRRQSKNVEDRRGVAAGAGMSGIVIYLLRLVIGRFGVRGVVVLAIIGGGFYMAGVNPMALLSGQPPAQQAARPADDEALQFVRATIAETEDVWTAIFAEAGSSYEAPVLVMFTQTVNSGCGRASAASGPFYCPLDRKAYLDPSFFRELSTRFGAPGDFAAVYVLAHEIGHHVQTVTGISKQVRSAKRGASKIEANALQVMMELQADCYAGVFANRAERASDFLDDGDVEEGLRAAQAIGDDTLQRQAGQAVNQNNFTHGSSAQRARWFRQGLRSGDVAACDTFNAASL